MDSTPAQMKSSPASMRIAPAAMWMAYIEEPQNRFTVAAPEDSGRSARKATRRAMLRPCSASGKAQPRIKSSTSAGSIPVRSTKAFTTCAVSSSGRTRARAPFSAKVKGERRYPAMTTFFIRFPLDRSSVAPRWHSRPPTPSCRSCRPVSSASCRGTPLCVGSRTAPACP